MATPLPTTWHLKTFRWEDADSADALPDISRVTQQQPLVDQDEPGFSVGGLHPSAERAKEMERTFIIFETQVPVNETGDYRLWIKSLQALRVTVDDELVLDRWSTSRGETTETDLDLPLSSGVHRIRIEAYHTTGELCLHTNLGTLGLEIAGSHTEQIREKIGRAHV